MNAPRTRDRPNGCCRRSRRAHLLANADEQPRPQIAARFVDQLECRVVGAKQVCSRKADHEDCLLLFLQEPEVLGPLQRRRRGNVFELRFSRRHLGKNALHERLHLRGTDVAENRHHAVRRNDMPVAKLTRSSRFRLATDGGSKCPAGVRRSLEQGREEVCSRAKSLFVLLCDACELPSFPGDRLLLDRGVQQSIRENLEPISISGRMTRTLREAVFRQIATSSAGSSSSSGAAPGCASTCL